MKILLIFSMEQTETMMNLRVGQGLSRGGGGGGGGGMTVAGLEDTAMMIHGETALTGPPSPTSRRYISDKHPRTALANINMLQKRRELCDVVLMVGNRKIFAHR